MVYVVVEVQAGAIQLLLDEPKKRWFSLTVVNYQPNLWA